MKKSRMFNGAKGLVSLCLLSLAMSVFAKTPTLESEIKITDTGLYFDGKKVGKNAPEVKKPTYDFHFGRRITPHGDSIKTFNEFVFLTWYKGGKDKRQVMLSRYNTLTGSLKTIEFPHRHTGFRNQPWIGESHNYIAVGISPLDGTVHLLYDMHAYGKTRPADGSLANDYFRYTVSKPNVATAPDKDFTLENFVKNKKGGYKHLSLTKTPDYAAFSGLTYPTFFLNTNNELLMYMRRGGNNNGGYVFSAYKAEQKTWTPLTQFNVMDAKRKGNAYNWGLYGSMKYVNGKLRVGFQQRSGDNNDRYIYQNGIFYAYSDNQDGSSDWKDHTGKGFDIPLVNSGKIKVAEPGDFMKETKPNSVHIVQGFDWTVTARGDVHFISQVRNKRKTHEVSVHTYKPAGSKTFISTKDFAGASSIYTSGDDIYIIGLNKSGRPFVEKAAGGTNNFKRIYNAKKGRQFRHGNVHISDGKLYYYLMEKGEGNAQPVYLQIINLYDKKSKTKLDSKSKPEAKPSKALDKI